MPRERRRSQRMVPPNATPIAVRAGEGGRLIDVSAHGALVEVRSPLAPSRRCSMTIENNGHPIEIVGEVRRCRAVLSPVEGVLVYHAALEFESGLDPEVEDWIVDVALDERSGSAPAVRRVVKVAERRR